MVEIILQILGVPSTPPFTKKNLKIVFDRLPYTNWCFSDLCRCVDDVFMSLAKTKNDWISSLKEVPPGSKKVSSMQRKLMHAQVQSLYYTGFLSIFLLTEPEGIWQDASCNLGKKSTTTPILEKMSEINDVKTWTNRHWKGNLVEKTCVSELLMLCSITFAFVVKVSQIQI